MLRSPLYVVQSALAVPDRFHVTARNVQTPVVSAALFVRYTMNCVARPTCMLSAFVLGPTKKMTALFAPASLPKMVVNVLTVLQLTQPANVPTERLSMSAAEP